MNQYPERIIRGDHSLLEMVAALDDHATEHIGAPCYVVVANPYRCTLCYSRVPVHPALWIPTGEMSLLFRHSNGWLLGGFIYFVCFECHAEIGDYVPVMAEEFLRAQLHEALAGSGNFRLEEAAL